jgi:hypothetical protein
LYEILSNPSLRLTDEDSLYSFICDHFELDLSWTILLDFVRFQYLQPSTVSHFATSLHDISEFLSPWTLRAMGDRLLSVRMSPGNRRRVESHGLRKEFRPNPESGLEGIIACLTRKHGGNVHDKEIVIITAKPPSGFGFGQPQGFGFGSTPRHPKFLADLESRTGYCSRCEPGQWICWDFKDLRVFPTHYAIKTCSGSLADHPPSWTCGGRPSGDISDREN